MRYPKTTAALVATSVLAGGTIGTVAAALDNKEIPNWLLPPVDNLPPELPLADFNESFICPAGTVPCSREKALGILASQHHLNVSLKNKEISKYAVEAIISAEDSNFYDHDGADPAGLGRAIVANAKAGSFKQGGSTITRQTADLVYPEATESEYNNGGFLIKLSRKIKPAVARQAFEISLARKMEQYHTKEQILDKYLDIIPFGRGAYGIEAAAQAYFGVHASDLKRWQGMILAGTINQPSNVDVNVLDPNDPEQRPQYETELAKLRQRFMYVADRLADDKKITQSESDRYKQEDYWNTRVKPGIINFTPNTGIDFTRASQLKARHFVDLAQIDASNILKKLGLPSDLKKGGYVVTTTLNSKNQTDLLAAMKSEPRIAGTDIEGAAVALEKDGKITAMIGSLKPYAEQQVNLAVPNKQGTLGGPAGSSNKGFFVAHALSKGMTLQDQIEVPPSITFPGGDPSSTKDDYTVKTGQGCDRIAKPLDARRICIMTLAEILAASSNTGTLGLVKKFGMAPIARNMQALRLPIKDIHDPSIALGSGVYTPLDEATAFNGLLLNKGVSTKPFTVSRIADNKGKVVYQHKETTGEQVFTPDVAINAAQAMNAVVGYGTAKDALNPQLTAAAAGKSGTSDKNKHLWFTGSLYDEKTGGQTLSIWLSSKLGIKAVQSSDVSKMWGRYLNAIATDGVIPIPGTSPFTPDAAPKPQPTPPETPAPAPTPPAATAPAAVAPAPVAPNAPAPTPPATTTPAPTP